MGGFDTRHVRLEEELAKRDLGGDSAEGDRGLCVLAGVECQGEVLCPTATSTSMHFPQNTPKCFRSSFDSVILCSSLDDTAIFTSLCNDTPFDPGVLVEPRVHNFIVASSLSYCQGWRCAALRFGTVGENRDGLFQGLSHSQFAISTPVSLLAIAAFSRNLNVVTTTISPQSRPLAAIFDRDPDFNIEAALPPPSTSPFLLRLRVWPRIRL
ncbi:hypothetical protein DFJ73DRAFT_767283 [Zopfochytrium polystomum]|nr:hypothetical protein DFJ73DRAFT_767283 [Zopfochytrium polystomum]